MTRSALPTQPARVSVITANLDSPVVGDVVAEVLRQAHDERICVEVVVAGRDGPGALARFRGTPGVTLVDSGGAVWPARARNLALERVIGGSAGGDLIASLDADCVPEPGWLAALVAAHRRHPGRCVVGGSLRIDAAGDAAFADNLASFHAYLPTRRPSVRGVLPACNASVRRDAFDEVGFFDETLEKAEDVDWMLRARRAGYELRFQPEVCAWHRSQRSVGAEVVAKAERTGYDSLAVRRRHGDALGRRFRPALAPVYALGVTGVALLRARGLAHHPRAVPLLLAAKLAWCRGAARRLAEEAGA